MLIKMALLRNEGFLGSAIGQNHKQEVAVILAAMHSRLEALLAELLSFREEFMKTKVPRMKRLLEKIDASVTDGGEQVDMQVIATCLMKLDSFHLPEFPSDLTEEAQVLTLTKPLHF